jgi:hypothetical protein
MLYQLSHVRMPVPGLPGPVRRISPALRQNCIRSWPNHQLGTEAKAENLSLERTRATPSPPLPQVSCVTPVASASASAAELISPAANTASSATALLRRAVVALGVTGPHASSPWGHRAALCGLVGRGANCATWGSASGAPSARARRSRESPRGQDGYRAGAPISSPVTRASAWGPWGTAPSAGRGGGPCGGRGGGPGQGPWGRPMRERPGGMAGGRGGPRLGGTEGLGNGGLGEPSIRGRGSFPRPVTGARAGKLVLPRPA